MPKEFTGPYSHRLSKECGKVVTEVKSRMPLVRNRAYLAAGESHMVVEEVAKSLYVNTFVSQPVNRFMPSVSVLFDSVAKSDVAKQTIALMLTGMGSDGAEEMLELRNAGAITIGQSEESCVVYGMPRSAAVIGATYFEASPSEMIEFISGNLKKAI
jgi:two-component system chemotaxis response regulator CheB